MAALMRKFCHTLPTRHTNIYVQMRGARTGFIRRTPLQFMTADEEHKKLQKHGVKIRDPRKEVDYIAGEPVMDNLKPRMNNKIRMMETLSKDEHKSASNIKHQMMKTSTEKEESRIRHLNITRLKDHDSRLVKDIPNAKSKKVRDNEKYFFLEGSKLISDALENGLKLKALYFTRKQSLHNLPLTSNDNIYQVTHHQMKLWSDLSTPQDIMAIFQMPPEGDSSRVPQDSIPLTVVLHKIHNAEQMGALIRISASVGSQRVLVLSKCTDVWDNQVLMSAAGGHFRVPIITNLEFDVLPNYLDNSSVFMTTNSRAIQEELQRDSQKIGDPMETVFLLDQLEDQSAVVLDSDISDVTDDSKSDDIFNKAPISVQFYSDVSYTNLPNITVIISGEAKRFTPQVRKFLYQHYADCVTLPMTEDNKSVSSVITASVVLYEVHKQFTAKRKQTKEEEDIQAADK